MTRLTTRDGILILSKAEVALNTCKMVNSLLDAAFIKEELQSHSLLGKSCNERKEEATQLALPQEKTHAIRDFVCKTFSGYRAIDFNRHGRERLSNIQRNKVGK